MANLAAMLRLPGNMKSTQWQILAGPILILLILSMMVLPLPAFILDLLFTFNIALSIMVLLVAMFTQRTLEFAAFPTILLFTTLLRLALNVASTRIILMEGHTGGAAAGKVVEAFGHFLVGGNFAIGIVVFVILVIINFMVITKGAGRIAEVGARFVLDGMPGKQMAIDADLNAGLIGEEEAKKRRSEVTQEADFYGSMDGASKFVRGDAVAGILIMVINVIGGLLVGVLQHDMAVGNAAESYTLLTIGDGLVAQIPALVISTAAGVIVTRVATDQDVGEQMVTQLFSNPRVMLLAAAVLGLLGLVPGMPNFVFLLFTGALLGLAWWMRGREMKAPEPVAQINKAPETSQAVEATWNDVQLEDSLGMEVGYRLIPMVDNQQDGELLGRIRSIRKKFAQEMGFLPPVVHIRDNMDLPPARYRILMKGVEIGSGEAYPGRWLAINPGTAAGTLPGEATVDPAFGLAAVWIESALKEQAQIQGFTVVEASTVVATHLNHLIGQFAPELFGRQEAQQLLDRVTQEMPKLTEDLVPGVLTLTTLHKVLQNLLSEKVPIRDMRTILETLAEHAPLQSDPYELTTVVRVALGRAITQQWFPGNGEVQVIGLDTALERLLLQALQGGGGLEPGLADRLLEQAQQALSRQEMLGAPPVLLVNHALRPLLARFLRRSLPQLVVLSNLELSDNRSIRMTATIGGQ
ncbi:flagellar biosynthesis protein FlhA [Siccibacter turicensis]|uniref:flagellar biosynthesis protein FlhA n=1 Tax=Siccibacter turicensis TaxID=357233 RepID=UPI000465F1D9|nr:flagellar biosynthesis protein FlhA [Siccibacter turicensis]